MKSDIICPSDYYLCICFVFWISNFNSLFAQFNQVPDEVEYQALLDLYNSTNGENWLNNSNWLHGNTIGDMATWHGVTVANGDVVEIGLNKNNLTGSIPYSIGDLLNLNYFNVYDNELTGEIPSSIGELTKLTHLYLGRNPLQGIIPDQLSSLTNLTYLYLDYTNLEGVVPEWIGTFTNLYHLYLGGPRTIGGLPTSMSNLIKLRHLSVSLISINGPLPNWIHNFKNLNLLYASQCGLTGKIPEWLGELPLKLLIMPKNHLEGELPKSFANLTELTHLYLFDNQLEGVLPHYLGDFSELRYFYIYKNNFSGKIPTSINKLSKLINFGFHANSFTSLPDFSNNPEASEFIVNVSLNKLKFEDIEKNFTGPSTHIFKSFTYSPLSEPPSEFISVGNGSSLILDAQDSAVHNNFQWQRMENGKWVDILGAVGSTYTIPVINDSSIGSYRCRITNDWVTGLTLYSRTIHVEVEEELIPTPPVDMVRNRPVD